MQDDLLGKMTPCAQPVPFSSCRQWLRPKEKADFVERSHDGSQDGKILPCSERLEEIMACALPFGVGTYLALSHIKPAPCELQL